jgi:hypothetical protein
LVFSFTGEEEATTTRTTSIACNIHPRLLPKVLEVYWAIAWFLLQKLQQVRTQEEESGATRVMSR